MGTANLGQLTDGKQFVSGRKQKLMIQTGDKYILSDMDLQVNDLFLDVRIAATCVMRDERLVTKITTRTASHGPNGGCTLQVGCDF